VIIVQPYGEGISGFQNKVSILFDSEKVPSFVPDNTMTSILSEGIHTLPVGSF